VPSLTGQLFDGNFELTGRIPLLAKDITEDNTGLQLTLDDLAFHYFDEIYSQVNGALTLTNALLDPVMGGQVVFQNTQVKVGPANDPAGESNFEQSRGCATGRLHSGT
jgi:hypothetical protein